MGFRQLTESAALWPLVAVVLAARAAQRRDAGSGPRDIGEIKGCLGRGNVALVIGAARCWFAFGNFVEKSPVRTTAPSLRHKTRTRNSKATHRPPFCTLVVDVLGNREVGARRVGSFSEFASDNLALEGPRRVPVCAGNLGRRARVLAFKGVLVEENRAVVLGDHVEDLRQRPISDKTCSFLYAKRRATDR